MKKQLIGFTFMAALLCSAQICASELNPIHIDGYEIKFPDRWIVEQVYIPGEEVGDTYTATAIYSDAYATITIADMDAGVPITAEYLMEDIDEFIIGFSSDLESFVCGVPSSYEKGEVDGVLVPFTTIIDGVPMDAQTILFPGLTENHCIMIIYMKSNDTFRLDDDFNSIMYSIKKPVEDFSFEDLDFEFYEDMPNDETGTWSLAFTTTTHPVKDYIKDYYETYVKPDDTTHIIINRTLNTTTFLGGLNHKVGYFDMYEYEYAEGDESDPKQCPGGELIEEYEVMRDTWEVLYADDYWGTDE